MCIRDREVLEEGRRQPVEGLVLATELEGDTQHAQREERHPCLLYTSDAADERSSVDLGGRRIIKKKNYSVSGDSKASN